MTNLTSGASVSETVDGDDFDPGRTAPLRPDRGVHLPEPMVSLAILAPTPHWRARRIEFQFGSPNMGGFGAIRSRQEVASL